MNKRIAALERSNNLVGTTLHFNDCDVTGKVTNYGNAKAGCKPFAWDSTDHLSAEGNYICNGLRVLLDSGTTLWVLDDTEVIDE